MHVRGRGGEGAGQATYVSLVQVGFRGGEGRGGEGRGGEGRGGEGREGKGRGGEGRGRGRGRKEGRREQQYMMTIRMELLDCQCTLLPKYFY